MIYKGKNETRQISLLDKVVLIAMRESLKLVLLRESKSQDLIGASFSLAGYTWRSDFQLAL